MGLLDARRAVTRILAAEPIPSFSRQAESFLVCRHLPHKGVWSQRDVATQAAKGTAGLHEKKYKILKSVFTSPYGLLLVLFCLDVRTTTHDILVLVLPVFFFATWNHMLCQVSKAFLHSIFLAFLASVPKQTRQTSEHPPLACHRHTRLHQ